MLPAADAVSYLLERQILTKAEVVDGGLLVEHISRRNHGLAVRTAARPVCFVKHADPRQSVNAVVREAAIYRLLWTTAPSFAQRHVPVLRAVDDARELLVLELVDGADTLADLRSGHDGLATSGAAELGRAIARLHTQVAVTSADLAAPPPLVSSILRPGRDSLVDYSSAALDAIRILQQSTIVQTAILALCRPSGRRAVVHGDLRLDSCLVEASGGTGCGRLLLVDWELGGAGDPCWDVGTVFGEYLSAWVRSLPLASFLALRDSLALATVPLELVLQDLSAFWASYRDEADEPVTDASFLLCSVQWTAARLLQSAIETAQTSAELSSSVVYLMQLGENILADPRHAVRHLLNLPVA